LEGVGWRREGVSAVSLGEEGDIVGETRGPVHGPKQFFLRSREMTGEQTISWGGSIAVSRL